MKVLVFFCIALSATLAQVPRPCLSPPQFNGRVYRVDNQNNFVEKARFFYDETDRRVRIVEEVEIGATRDFYDTIALFNLNKEYKINLKTKQCNTSALTRPFIPVGVPPEAKFDFDAEIGAANLPNEHLTVQAFHGNYTGGPFAGDSFYGLSTYPGCVPIRFVAFGKAIGFYQSDYFDIGIGNPDPNVFTPPSNCPP